ncbi:TonB family protein [Acetobacteraceae bacterium H6797]|nr:TonB family protein [Acetobacteraceae bacterium H6797]
MTQPEASRSLPMPPLALEGEALKGGREGAPPRLAQFAPRAAGAPRGHGPSLTPRLGPPGGPPGGPPRDPDDRGGLGPRPLAARMRPSRRTLWIAASVLLHLALIGFFFIQPHKQLPEPLPPPTVSMVFDGGSGDKVSSQPQPQGGEMGEPVPPAPETPPTPPLPTAEPPPPPPAPAPPEVPPPPAPAVPTPPAPAPPLPRETATAPPPPVPTPVPPPLTMPPLPPTPPAPSDVADIPPPPPAPPEPAPRPAPAQQAEPQPRPPQTLRQLFPNALDLSRTPSQAYNLARPTPQQRRLDPQVPFALSPNSPLLNGRQAPMAGGADSSAQLDPNLRIRGANLGGDWRAAFHDWLRRNGRYPQEAARRGEDGSATIRFTVTRDGNVRSVQLINRSGSQILDSYTQGLLRYAQLPPFPAGTQESEATIDLTINYVLIRR